MFIKLTWDNPNTGAVTINIYRGDTPLDRSNLGTPIATLTNGELEYTDNTVVFGNTYYYVLETVLNSEKVSTLNYITRAATRRGPGPGELAIGDYDYGYFGTISSLDFIDGISLALKVGLTAGAATASSYPTWHKYVRNNKVCFIPEGSLRSTLNWKNIYDAGLVFGVDGPGPYNAGADVNQLKTVQIGPDTFKVRLMRGYNDDDSVLAPVNTINEPIEAFTCEWDDFVYPISKYVPTAQRMVNVANNTNNQLRLLAQYYNWCQEKTTNSVYMVTRGASIEVRAGITARGCNAYSITPNTPHGWWPVLELIEG